MPKTIVIMAAKITFSGYPKISSWIHGWNY